MMQELRTLWIMVTFLTVTSWSEVGAATEIIVRESAIFGILGVATLGYHVDAAISELRFDVAVVLILATVGLCALIDALSRWLRKSLRISMLATRLAQAPAK